MKVSVLTLTIAIQSFIGHVRAECHVANCYPNSCSGYSCNSCNNGYYLYYGSWCEACKESCLQCTGKWSCSECVYGRYGSYCQGECSKDCKNGVCSDTQCTDGCIDGKFLSDYGYCQNCNTLCRTCIDRYSCSSCKINKWGSTCQNDCSNCKAGSCHITNGCLDCVEGYYMDYNTDLLGNICSACPGTCTRCRNAKECTECRAGYWGSKCENDCNICENDLCSQQRGCYYGCKDGYYLRSQSVPYYCDPCPDTCKACTSTSTCSECESGYWGLSCQMDCNVCENNLCHRQNGCTTGCKTGYYQRSDLYTIYCDQCPENCIACTSSTICSTCVQDYTGNTCQHDCRSCNGQLCEYDTGECSFICTTAQFFDQTRTQCIDCPMNCTQCTSSSFCSICKNGNWGTTCESPCSQNCIGNMCSKAIGRCNGCKDGFFGPTCSEACLMTCKTCTDSRFCQSCKDDYFSIDYSKKCECIKSECIVHSNNVCKNCSRETYYPVEQGCCPCSDNCKNNVCLASGVCIDCDEGNYGDKCQYSCRTYCKDGLCYRNGTCVSCEDGRYGEYCTHYCNNYCKDRLCYKNGSCISCIDGRYGDRCNSRCYNQIDQCSKCFIDTYHSVQCTACYGGYYPEENVCKRCNENCKSDVWPYCNSSSGKCLYGCNDHWYGDKCDSQCNVSKCALCTSNHNICEECIEGHYLESNTACVTCPPNCSSHMKCNKNNGSCEEGCIDGKSGIKCDLSCSTGCLRCDQFNVNDCSTCKNGFYGDACEYNCSLQCEVIEKTNICSKSSGWCHNGCNDGFWGSYCNAKCGEGCAGGQCNRTTGVCFQGCTYNYHNGLCNERCSENCFDNVNIPNDRKCEESSGRCIYGCLEGWYGEVCEMQCSQHCNRTTCNRWNGTCEYGCITGYVGHDCMQAAQVSLAEDNNSIAVGAGAGASVAVVVIIVIVVVVIVMRRRRTSSKAGAYDYAVSRQGSQSASIDDGRVYSNIDDVHDGNKTENSTSNLTYAVASPVRMSDLIEAKITPEYAEVKDTANDRRTILSDDQTDEEDLETDMENEAVDDTYYNTASKRVAVNTLADYVKSKTFDELTEEFQKLPKGLIKESKAAKQPRNSAKNRYKNIYPYDESRVILTDGGSDYINASYIEGYTMAKEYIASSGPFKKKYDTTADFWRMIWQEKSETLVMLTNTVENEEMKCEKYWPDVRTSKSFGKFEVSCIAEDVYADFVARIFTVKKDKTVLNVQHLHYTAWPDKGVPHDVTSMVEFRQKVRSVHKDRKTAIVVHCSAGIGRTGTFIALDMLTNEGEDRGSVDIFGCLATLRSQRCNMVQTAEQYQYLHHAIEHSLAFDCRNITGVKFVQHYNNIQANKTIDQQFQHLQLTCEEITEEEKEQITTNASLPEKNREIADVPGDDYRVKLLSKRNTAVQDYINAVYVNVSHLIWISSQNQPLLTQGYRTSRKFITAQSPLPSTIVDFLSLIYQEKCSCIVMMDEADTADKSIGMYWPADNLIINHGIFSVGCKESETSQFYTLKKLSLICHGQKGEEERDVNLFIFNKWPMDSVVPSTSGAMLQFIKDVDTEHYKADKESSILIHCKTGASRSCLYCAVAVLIEKMEIEQEVSVVNTLRQIKARRRSAIPNIEQYKFCHQAVISYLQSFETYSNFGLQTS